MNEITFDSPAVEDAFYFLNALQKGIPEPLDEESPEDYEARMKASFDPSIRAGDRLAKLPYEERMRALAKAREIIGSLHHPSV